MRSMRAMGLAGVVLAATAAPAAATGVTRSCTLQSPGDACILGFGTRGSGNVSVCTQAGRSDERWRSTLAQKAAIGGQTAVGSGSTTQCGGRARLTVVAGGHYLAVITLDRPAAGGFPRTVAITLSGPLAGEPALRPNGPGSLVVNGDFEQGPDPAPAYFRLPAGNISIPGWPVTSGTVDHVSSPYWQSISGLRNIDLSGYGAGSIAQAINGLIVGQAYVMTFRLAGNPDCGNRVKKMSVLIDNTAHPFEFDTTGGSHANLMWTSASFGFVYEGANPNLQFVSHEASICGPIIDDVRLVPTP
jgi:choice-of-anchor C domain-containing protein